MAAVPAMKLDEGLNPRLVAVRPDPASRSEDRLELEYEAGGDPGLDAPGLPGAVIQRGPRGFDRRLFVRRAALESWVGEVGEALRRAVAGREAGARTWSLAGRSLRLDPESPAVMGILNVTPDSFSDGGVCFDPAVAVQRGLRMVADGAFVIDVGGESTRPGSDPIPQQEELRRVLPVVRALASQCDVPVSIDTTKAAVAEAALDAGAAIVNDTSAGTDDPRMAQVAATTGAGFILMHRQRRPRTMQQDPSYEYCRAEVCGFLRGAARRALEAGVSAESIVIDPGIGFGKRLEDNLELVGRVGELRSTGFAVLLGASRKAFLGTLSGSATPAARDAATQATTAVAFREGIEMVRVHDVAAAVDLLKVLVALESLR